MVTGRFGEHLRHRGVTGEVDDLPCRREFTDHSSRGPPPFVVEIDQHVIHQDRQRRVGARKVLDIAQAQSEEELLGGCPRQTFGRFSRRRRILLTFNEV